MNKKSISSTVICITNENAINSFRLYFCGTPFPARSVLADPNQVRDALLSLNHSKSYLCGSDFKIGQAHKHLHLTNTFKMKAFKPFQNDLQK